MVTVNITVTDDAVQPEIYLGRQGEKQAREIVFDLSALREKYGAGTATLYHQRAKDPAPYLIAETTGTTMTWTVSETDTVYAGIGYCEFRYTFGTEGLSKSTMFATNVKASLSGDVIIPAALQAWYDALIEYIDTHSIAQAQLAQAVVDYIEEHPLEGVPSGGAEGQVLVKKTGADFDAEWSDGLSDVNSAISDIDTALNKSTHSSNYLNPNEILKDVQIKADGTEEPYAGRNSSGWIPASTGDTVYFAGINSDGQLMPTSALSILRLAWYNSDKTFIGATTWTNGYVLSANDIAYIRICYVNSTALSTARVLAVMFTQPTTVTDIEVYDEGRYHIVDSTARNMIKQIIPDKFVDAWGDSRIANGKGNTSVDKYLANMLGWYTANHGYGGQGSGEIAITMGAIDCYVTLENNQILDGDNIVSAITINHGNSVQNVMQNSNVASNGVPCSIGGINGFLWRYGGELKFTTASTLNNAVSIMPMTKVITPIAMLHRFIVIWAGKNDFSNYSASGLYEYLADTVSAMAEHIPHDRFVILGETATSSDEYKFGGAARTVMENYNNLMAKRFPNNFIDIHNELVENGLDMAGITPTETDISDIQNGWLPSSLMSDTTHQNEICRNVIAQIIYNFMVAKSWT